MIKQVSEPWPMAKWIEAMESLTGLSKLPDFVFGYLEEGEKTLRVISFHKIDVPFSKLAPGQKQIFVSMLNQS